MAPSETNEITLHFIVFFSDQFIANPKRAKIASTAFTTHLPAEAAVSVKTYRAKVTTGVEDGEAEVMCELVK